MLVLCQKCKEKYFKIKPKETWKTMCYECWRQTVWPELYRDTQDNVCEDDKIILRMKT